MKILIFIILIIIALLSSRFYYLAIKDREAVQKARQQLKELKTQNEPITKPYVLPEQPCVLPECNPDSMKKI